MYIPDNNSLYLGIWLPAAMRDATTWNPRYTNAVLHYIEGIGCGPELDDFLDAVGIGSQSTVLTADHVRRMHDHFTPAQVHRQRRESAEWAYYVDMLDLNDLLKGQTSWDDKLRRHMSDWLVQHGTAAEAVRFADLADHPDLTLNWQEHGPMGWIPAIMISITNQVSVEAYRALWQQVSTERAHGAYRHAWARDWAKCRYPIGHRGRLPATILEQYDTEALGFNAAEPEKP